MKNLKKIKALVLEQLPHLSGYDSLEDISLLDFNVAEALFHYKINYNDNDPFINFIGAALLDAQYNTGASVGSIEDSEEDVREIYDTIVNNRRFFERSLFNLDDQKYILTWVENKEAHTEIITGKVIAKEDTHGENFEYIYALQDVLEDIDRLKVGESKFVSLNRDVPNVLGAIQRIS